MAASFSFAGRAASPPSNAAMGPERLEIGEHVCGGRAQTAGAGVDLLVLWSFFADQADNFRAFGEWTASFFEKICSPFTRTRNDPGAPARK
jgi:hypothetical protein